MQKTLAMKALEGRKISYETVVYPTSLRDAELIAVELDVAPETVFKTLVVLPPAGKPKAKPILALIPAVGQLNLKKLAKVVGVKKVKMATHAQAEQLTGLQVGGISPLALLNKRFAVYIDQSAQGCGRVFVSAGQRGINLKVDAEELAKITKARWAELT